MSQHETPCSYVLAVILIIIPWSSHTSKALTVALQTRAGGMCIKRNVAIYKGLFLDSVQSCDSNYRTCIPKPVLALFQAYYAWYLHKS